MADNKDIILRVNEAVSKAMEGVRKRNIQLEEDRKLLVASVSKDIMGVLSGLLEEIAENSKLNKQDLADAMRNVKINIPSIDVAAPEIVIPPIKVPTPQVHYTPPQIKFPEFKMPDEMNIKGWVSLMGVDLAHPLPVQLRDAKGNPVQLFDNITQIIGGGGGGNFKNITLNGINNSAWGTLLNSDGRLRVETSDSSGTQGVDQVSGATWSVSVNDIFRTTVTSTLINSDDRLRVSLETGGSGLTDAELRATAVPVSQVSGANWSVSVTGMPATTIVVGDDLADAADSGGSPVKIGGIARTANPAAVAAGDRVSATFDKLGRQLVIPYQIRDLIATARASVTTGAETTLLAGAASTFHDCAMITFANQSTAVVDVDIRDATGGGIVATITVPADNTAGWAPAIPYPQNVSADTWTFQNSGTDQSNTTIVATGLFIKNL